MSESCNSPPPEREREPERNRAHLAAESAQRVLRLGGASNCRDLGGYRTRSGQCVRWRRVFRADRLDALNADDWRRLAALRVGTVIDLRAAKECDGAPFRKPAMRRVALPIESALGRQLAALRAAGTTVDGERMRGLMQQEYRRILLDHADRFAELLRVVADADDAVIFHCAAGKDRTGIAAALLLGALGVDRATIKQDYLLTNETYRRPADLQEQGRASGLSTEALDVMWSVHASHLDAAFEAVEELHGGLEGFLSGPLAVSPALRRRLADRLLENA